MIHGRAVQYTGEQCTTYLTLVSMRAGCFAWLESLGILGEQTKRPQGNGLCTMACTSPDETGRSL